MQISIRHNINQITRRLSNIQKRQIPFAASQALNDTAFAAQKELKKQARKKIDRPTKFTINAFQVRRATKRNLESAVFIEEKRWKYLQNIIKGRTQVSSRKGFGVPVNARLNKFGNIPGRAKGLIKKKNQFVATINGKSGVYERIRKTRQVKLMVAFEKQTTHKKQINLFRIVDSIVKAKFNQFFEIRLRRAIETAR